MENNKENIKEPEFSDDFLAKIERTQNRGRLFGGIFIVIIGVLFLGKELGLMIPDWIFSWQMLLIAIGIYIGLKHSFRNFAWIVLLLIGTTFLIRDLFPELAITRYLWPIAIIVLGLAFIFKPKKTNCVHTVHRIKRRYDYRSQGNPKFSGTSSKDDDYIELSAVFGSVSKHIITKDFKGGEVNAVFGGVELNLTQADFEGRVELEINAAFGGARLIIPPHWEVQSELAAVLGSVEDKRPMYKDPLNTANKILVLKGNAVFGGIEIKSF